MFMAVGKRTPRKRIGYVADYCPVCRDVRVFALKKVGSGWHVNFIPLGPAKTLGHELWCETCGGTYFADPKEYPEVAGRPMDDAVRLAEMTTPTLMERSRERFDFDDAILNGTYDPHLRFAIMREPFDLLNHAVYVRMKNPTVDRGTKFLLAIGVLGVAILIASIASHSHLGRGHRGPPSMVFIAMMMAFVGFLAAAVRFSSEYRRYIRAQAVPAIAKAISPVDPTLDELKLLRKAIKKDKLHTRFALEPRKLHRAIAEHRAGR